MQLIKAATAVLASLVFFCACGSDDDSDTDDRTPEAVSLTPTLGYTMGKVYPHDTTAFTEGLLMHEGALYESTGATSELPQTRSLFGEVDLKTGKITTKAELDRNRYFGEGIVFLNGKVYQLTYRTKVGFVYDAKNFKPLGQFTFPSAEGWGMTTDGRYLIMSDGTNTLTFLDPENYATVKQLKINDENGPVNNINELEYVKGEIYANIYTTNRIIRIDSTGKVTGRLELDALANEARNRYYGSLQMNGIAYDPSTGSLLVTGKMWPYIFEVRVSN
jgi:glutaminyl-peptide cyclotransferase